LLRSPFTKDGRADDAPPGQREDESMLEGTVIPPGEDVEVAEEGHG
jgi:hypothetical protein